MKIFVRNIEGQYFSRYPEVGFTKNKNFAFEFNCINDEHAKIILEKTKIFTYQNDLIFENMEQEVLNENKEKESSTKS